DTWPLQIKPLKIGFPTFSFFSPLVLWVAFNFLKLPVLQHQLVKFLKGPNLARSPFLFYHPLSVH
ncbi:MAG: hypothetical protein KGY56_14585, partial [Desulfobacterales bacterium]|nr:hypothetical protein [Desulfobacterales bacterium]